MPLSWEWSVPGVKLSVLATAAGHKDALLTLLMKLRFNILLTYHSPVVQMLSFLTL